MKQSGLGRQIKRSMMAMALCVTLLFVLTAYIFYFFWEQHWPKPATSTLFPTTPEWIWIIATTVAALILASWMAINLSSRILAPLLAVTEGIRRLAHGDLSVSNVTVDPSMGEVAGLVTDFNDLARRLRQLTEERVFWNAAIAHELRTPVTILRGRLQGLAEGVFSPNEAQFSRLLLQVEGLSRIIEDLRVVSLSEGGHLDLRLEEVDLASEIHALIDVVLEPLEKAGKPLLLDIRLRTARCDPARIRQALLALLDNAKKHSNPGTIRLAAFSMDGGYHLSVSDEGPGIPVDYAPYVFTAFRRSPEVHEGGSGLGLAVVAAIAKAHGGSARWERTPSGGTLFALEWGTRGLCDTSTNEEVNGTPTNVTPSEI